MAQDDKRSFALFGQMEMYAICHDRAMRDASDRLRVSRTGLINSVGRCRAETSKEFASLHG